MNITIHHAPPSPSPGAPTTAPTASVSVSSSPGGKLPVTGTSASTLWTFVGVAFAFVVIGVVILAAIQRLRRGHVH